MAETLRAGLGAMMLEVLLPMLLRDGRVALPGFGAFALRTRPERVVRHPQTKALMTIPASLEVRFHAAKRLKGMARKSPVVAGMAPPVLKCEASHVEP